MKKTIIEEYNDAGKLIKKTTIEEDPVNHNGMYNPYNPVGRPTITNVPTVGVVDCLDKSIIYSASDTTKATLKGE